MKKINILVSILCILFVCSCSNSVDKLEKLIPENTAWIVKINLDKVLTKSGFVDKDGNVKIPESLNNSLSNTDTFAKRIISSLPSSGIKFDESAFLFNSGNGFDIEILAFIDDSKATKQWICKLTAESIVKQSGNYQYIYEDNVLYMINDNVLLIGIASKKNEKDALSYANALFSNTGKSIVDNKQACEVLNKDADATAYVIMNNAKNGSRINKLIAQYPALSILTETDIQALSMTMNFDKDLSFDIDIATGNNSAYSIIYSTMLCQPSADFLEIIPETINTVFAVSIKGNNLLSINEFRKLLDSTGKMPIIRDLDLPKLISTIDGPAAIGISADADFVNEYNYVAVVSSNDPEAILNDINRVTRNYGQYPQKNSTGDFIYNYYNQKIAIGISKNKYVYFKVMNYPHNGGYLNENTDLANLFKKSKIGFYTQFESQNQNFELSIGSTSASKIEGKLFASGNIENNIINSLIQLICEFEPKGEFEDMDNTDIEYGGFEPIDEMSEM